MAQNQAPAAERRMEVGQTLHMPKMAELIGDVLRRQIVHGDLKEGDALPSEAVLMEQFGVSRPTLREAFRVLESESLISIRRGAHGGARVKGPDQRIAARYAGLILEYRGTTLQDVFDARSVIESECAGLAARHRTKRDLDRLEEIYESISASEDIHDRIVKHGEFDAAVVEASGNQTFVVLVSMLRSIIDKSTLESVTATADSPATIKAYNDAHRAHRRLIDLIRKKDAAAATAHWRRHLDLAEEFVLSTGVSEHSVLDLI
jgi:GntR family transcriptional regulator, transcriptional repressor for pyruvate dehydrogenase complex